MLQHALNILPSTQYNSGRSRLRSRVLLRKLLIFFEADVLFLVLQMFILAAGTHSLEGGPTVVFHGRSCSSLVGYAEVCRSSEPVAFSLWCDVTEGQNCIHKQQTRWFIAQGCYRRQPKVHTRLKTVWVSLRGGLIQRGLWPLHYPDLTSRDFNLQEVLMIKCIKHISTLFKD